MKIKPYGYGKRDDMGWVKRTDNNGNVLDYIVNGVDMIETGLINKVQKIYTPPTAPNPNGTKIEDRIQQTEEIESNQEWLAETWKAQQDDDRDFS